MSYLDEHAPLFPPYVNEKRVFRADILAWTSGRTGKVTTQHGETHTFSTFADLQYLLFSQRGQHEQVRAILLFTECSLMNFCSFNECLEETAKDTPGCEIYKNGQDEAVMIKVFRPFHETHGARVAYIVSRKNWLAMSDLAPADFLNMMQALFDYVGLGTYPSPASLGMAILRQCWLEQYGKQWRDHRHSRPALGILRALKEVEPVGLVETIAKRDQTFDEAYEIDSKSAYISQWRSLPTGTCVPFGRTHSYTHRELMKNYKYYIAVRCTCVITEQLPVGVFPQRVPLSTNSQETHVIQPIAPGIYENISMSSETIEVAQSYGVRVTIHAGYGWTQLTDDCNCFVDKMQQLRDHAPNDWIRATMKVVGVAVVGAMGMDYRTGILTTRDNPKATRIITILSNGVEYDMGIIEREDTYKPIMVHWHYKAIDGTRAMMTPQIMRYAMEQTLVSVDTDGFVTTSLDVPAAYLSKEEHKNTVPNGTMLWSRHTNLHDVVARSYQSDQRDKRPGVARKRRK